MPKIILGNGDTYRVPFETIVRVITAADSVEGVAASGKQDLNRQSAGDLIPHCGATSTIESRERGFVHCLPRAYPPRRRSSEVRSFHFRVRRMRRRRIKTMKGTRVHSWRSVWWEFGRKMHLTLTVRPPAAPQV